MFYKGVKSLLLKDKVCIVTGANRGIGKAVVESFAREGAIIYANARKEHSLDDFAAECIDNYSCQVIPSYFDVRDTMEIQKLMGTIYRSHGGLDILVNNAGIMRDAFIGMVTQDTMREVFETNVFATMNLLQYSTKLMKRQKSGSIINFSSIVGIHGNIGQLVYSASKGAVIALTKTAAKELAPYQIRVNAVAPGMIDTDMLRSIGEERIEGYRTQIGMGRLGMGQDVAEVCVWLASDYSVYVTGQIIGIDGAAVI